MGFLRVGSRDLYPFGYRADFQGYLHGQGGGMNVQRLLVELETAFLHGQLVGIERYLEKEERAVHFGFCFKQALGVKGVGQLDAGTGDGGAGFVQHRAAHDGGGLSTGRNRGQAQNENYDTGKTCNRINAIRNHLFSSS